MSVQIRTKLERVTWHDGQGWRYSLSGNNYPIHISGRYASKRELERDWDSKVSTQPIPERLPDFKGKPYTASRD